MNRLRISCVGFIFAALLGEQVDIAGKSYNHGLSYSLSTLPVVIIAFACDYQEGIEQGDAKTTDAASATAGLGRETTESRNPERYGIIRENGLPQRGETMKFPSSVTIRPLTEEEIHRGLKALTELEELGKRISARRKGKSLPPAWQLVRQARDELSKR